MGKKGRILFMTPNLKGAATGKNRIQPPLGPGIMAKILDKQGYNAKVHDCALENWTNRTDIGDNTIIYGQTDDEIAATISNYNPDIVAVSALFSNLVESAHNIARISKQVKPRAKVILGGNHISNSVLDYLYAKNNKDSKMSDRLVDMEDTNIDYAMRGEVDLEFPKLVYAIINGQDLSRISGLVMRKNRSHEEGLEYLVNDVPDRLDITQLPISPLWNPESMEKYFEIGSFHHPFMRKKKKDAFGNDTEMARVLPIMCSRGCPEKCNFCTTPEMWGSNVRWRKVEDILEEIKIGVRDYKIEEIQFEDDTITANKKFLYELCGGLEKIGVPWCTPNGTKANYHTGNSDMYKIMRNSGCYQITIAGESGVQRVLDQLANKRLKVEEIAGAIDKARESGLFVHTFGILGFPGIGPYPAEKFSEMCQTIEAFSAMKSDSYSFAIYNPLPGTPHYREVIKNNLWWPGRSLEKMKFRSSLIKVDGFDGPEQFERFVEMANKTCNGILRTREPQRHAAYLGDSVNQAYQVKVT